MTWDITQARTRAGLAAGDITQDASLQIAMATALAIAENYCSRSFFYKIESVAFYQTASAFYSLARYPIEAVSKVSSGGKYVVHHTGGWIKFNDPVFAETLQVDYAGGYKVLPSDLELALWQIFDTAHAMQSSAGGGAVSTNLKKVAITGVGSIDYDVSTSGGSTASGGGMGGLLPTSSASILDMYRRELA